MRCVMLYITIYVRNSWIELNLENWLAREDAQELINTWLSLHLINLGY